MSELKTIQPHVVLDSFAMYFPFFSSYNAPRVQASNGVSFWRSKEKNHWYTTAELSRYTADGDYTPCATDDNGVGLLLYLAYRYTRPVEARLFIRWYNVILKKGLRKLPPHLQNNTNSPTAKGVCTAIDRIYNGYMETIRPGERESFEALVLDPEFHDKYTPKITRLDTALDLPPSIIPTPDDLLYYVRHGRGSRKRYIKVAARQGIYIYDKKEDIWYLIVKDANGKTKAVFTRPYFMRSLKRLKKAILTNEITIYIGTRNGEIKIYAKGGLVRYELSAKKSILRRIMPDRRIAALSDPSVLSHLFHAAAGRIGELFRRSLRRYGLYLRAVRQAIGSFIRNFVNRQRQAAGYYTRLAISYNNVIHFLPLPLAQRERPPPFLLMTAPISEQ